MAAIISGNSLGISNSSLFILGSQGLFGNSQTGRSGENLYVDIATGNVVLQTRDDLLIDHSTALATVRTYNEQGTVDNGVGRQFQFGFFKQVTNLTGTVNTAGSTVTRMDGDGATFLFTYNTARGVYVSTDGSGAFDTISFNAATNIWTFTDGDTRVTEQYDRSNAGRITSVTDTDGNSLFYVYGSGGTRVTQIVNSDGETTNISYVGTESNLVSEIVRNGPGGPTSTLTRVRYTYDTSNRLIQVTYDLSPQDNSTADNNVYRVNYTYVGTTGQIATVSETDGTRLSFTYVTVGGLQRVATVTDALGHVTSYSYNTTTRTTTVTDPLGFQTQYGYDTSGRLTSVRAASGQQTTYTYDASGNLATTVDGEGHTVTMQYDANGNQILQRDSAGNTITRTYSATNQLLTETVYAVPDPDGAGPAQPGAPMTTRYAYDSHNHLRFVITQEGRVTEYRYDALGNRVASIEYTGALYPTAGLAVNVAPNEATMQAWVASIDKSQSIRADMTYDFRGLLATATTYSSVDSTGAGVLDGTQSVTHYVYDQAGNLLQSISPSAGTTTYVYDGLGRVLSTTDAQGNVTVNTYDDANNRTTTHLANGLATTSVFDRAGELVSVIQNNAAAALLGQTNYYYDADGRLRMTQDPTGLRTYMLYDSTGRKVADIDANGSLTEYVYNNDSKVVRTIAYATAVNVSLLVDASGNPANVTLAAIRPAATAQDQSTWKIYDQANRLVKTVDEAGFVTEQVYDGASRVTDIIRYATPINTATLPADPQPGNAVPPTSAADRHTRNFYDQDGLLRGTLDAEGFLTEYRYNAGGERVETIGYANATPAALRLTGTLAQLIPATSPDDIHSHTLYNARGQIAATVDGEGEMTETVYDASGNVARVVRYATKVVFTSGATLASLRPASSPEDQVSSYTYNTLSQLVSETDASGTLTTYSYDNVGNLISTSRAVSTSETRTLTARYDLQGRLTGTLSGEGSALLTGGQTQAQIDAIFAAYGTTFTYDAAGRKTSSTDPNGNKTLYFYDVDGHLTQTVNALGEVIENKYNTLGQLVTTIQYGTRLSTAGLTGGVVTPAFLAALAAIRNPLVDSVATITYNTTGTVASTTDALGNTVTHTYDAFREEVASSQQIDATHALDHTYAYDKRGLLTQTVWDPAGVAATTVTQYDAFGRAIQITDANGKVTRVSYDHVGRAVTTTDPLNNVRSTSYDAIGRVLTQTDALGNVTTYSYNTAARSVTVTSPEGVSVTTVRNRNGQTQSVTDGRGNTTSYVYDRNGNLIQSTNALGQTTTNVYDHSNRLIDTMDGRGTHVAYTYDAVNRMLTRTVDPTGLHLTTSYVYDAKGQQIQMTDANGVVMQYQFDLKGEVTRQTLDPSGLNLTTTYSYDGRGKVLTVTDPRGIQTRYVYDALGRRLEEHVDPTGLNLTKLYSYDKNGNAVTATDANGNVTRYVYDADNRLVYTIDPMGAVTENDYNAQGSIVKTVAYAAPISLSGLSPTPTLAQVQSLIVVSPNDALTENVYDRDGRRIYAVNGVGAVTHFVYDADGNIVERIGYAHAIAPSTPPTAAAIQAALVPDATHDADTRTVYDALNRAIYAVDGTGGVMQNIYDANGNIVERIAYAATIPTSTPPTAAAIASAVAAVADPARDNDTKLVYDTANRVSYSLDALGDVTHDLYDANGNLIETIAYAHPIPPSTPATAAAIQAALVPDATQDSHTCWTYDAANRQVFIVDSVGAVTQALYDADGNVTERIDYANTISVALPATNASVEAALVPDAARDRTQFAAFDAAGRLVFGIDALGEVTQSFYDANGNVVGTLAYANPISLAGLGSSPSPATIQARLVPSSQDRGDQNVFDADNRLVYKIDALNFVSKAEYDALGHVTRTIRYANAIPAGTPATLAGVSAALTSSAADQVTSFVYDAAGRTVQDIDALGFSESSTYDALGNKLTFTDKNGTLIQYVYDQLGRAVEQHIDPAGLNLTARSAYDAHGNVVTSTDADGNVARMVYDAVDRQVYAIDPTGGVTETDYDALGRASRTIAYATPISLAGLPAAPTQAQVQARITPASNDNVSRNVYDQDGRLLYSVNGVGGVTQSTYDAFGNVLERRTYANPIPTSTPATAAAIQAALVPDAAHDADTRGVYDALNRAIYTVDGTGAVTQVAFDTFGNVVDHISYATPVPAGTPATAAALSAAVVADPVHDGRTRVVYDLDNRAIYTINGLGDVSQSVYDANGNVIESIAYSHAIATSTPATAAAVAAALVPDAAHDNHTCWTYDADNRRVFNVDTLGEVSQNFYDANGNVTERVAYANTVSVPLPATTAAVQAALVPDAAHDETVHAVHDAAGRVVYTIDSLGDVSQNFYDANGNTVSTLAYANPISLVGLGSNPSLATVQALLTPSALDRTTQSVYDADNRVVYAIDALGFVRQNQYDALSDITSSVQYANAVPAGTPATLAGVAAALTPNAAADQTDTFTYDAAGHVTQSTDALGFTESFTYDALGNRLTATNKNGAICRYDYDAAGRMITQTEGPVAMTTVAQNPDGSFTVNTDPAASLVTRLQYDARGQLIARTEALGRPEQRTTLYAYDAVGRQVQVTYPPVNVYNAAADDLARNGTTGTMNREDTPTTLTSSTTYDALGNAVVNQDVAGNFSYKVYDQWGQVRFDVDAEHNVTEYQRDAFGNVTQLTRYPTPLNFGSRDPSAALSVEDVQAMLAAQGAAAHAGDRTITSTYDLLNRVTQVVEPAAFTFDSSAPVGSQYFTAGKTTKNFYNAFGQVVLTQALKNPLLGQWTNTATNFYDQRGNQSATVDALGFLTTMSYDASGNLTDQVEFAQALASWSTAGYSAPTPTADDRETRYGYDQGNRQTSQTQVNVEFSTAADGTSTRGDVTTTYGYDAVGNLTRTTDAKGHSTYTYYDALGHVTAIVSPERSDEPDGTVVTPLTVFKLDAYGNIVQRIDYARGAASADATTYTVAGADPNDRTSYSLYDTHGHMIQLTDADGNSKFASYDARGEVAKQWQPITGNDGAVQYAFTVFHYDKLGRVVSTTEPASLTNLSEQLQPGATQVQSAFVNWVIGESNTQLFLSWDSLSGLGGGDVRVDLDYTNAVFGHDESGNVISVTPGSAVSTSQTFSAGSALNGVTMNLGDGITSVGRVQVWKMQQNGQWVKIEDTTMQGATGNHLKFASPNQAGVQAQFLYRPSGSTGAFTALPAADMFTFETGFMADVSSLLSGTYDFQINYVQQGDTAVYATMSGTVTTNTNAGGSVSVSDMALGVGGFITRETQYDAFGEAVIQGTDGGNQQYFNYDNAGQLWRTNSGDGIVKVSLYDLNGDSTSDIRSMDRDLGPNAFSSPDPIAGLGDTVRTDTVYDLRGREVKQIEPSWTESGGTVSQQSAFLTASIDPSFMSVGVSYTSLAALGSGDIRIDLDYVNAVFNRDESGNIISVSPGSETTHSQVFNGASAAAGATVDVPDGITSLNSVSVFKKDINGNWVQVFSRSSSNFGPSGNLVFVTAPDDPNIQVTLQYRLSGSTGAFTPAPLSNFGEGFLFDASQLPAGTYEYQVLYQRPGETSPTVHDSSTVTLVKPEINQTVDRWGNVTSVSDPRFANWITFYRYNAFNEVIERTQPDGNGQISAASPDSRTYYDSLGRKVATRDADGNVNGLHYDAAGDLVKEMHADGGLVHYGYDAFGDQIKVVDAMNNVCTYTFDHVGNLLQATHAPVNVYSDNGSASFIGTEALSETYVYDQAGRRIRVTDGAGDTNSYDYDLRSNVLKFTQPMGQVTHYAYDVNNYKIAELNPNFDNATWTYSFFGQTTAHTDIAGFSYTYSYDGLNHLKDETSTNGVTNRVNQVNTYDAAGHLVSVDDIGIGQVTTYAYDAAGNHVRETTTQGGVVYQDNHLAYDTLGRLADLADSRYHLMFEYDAVGNRVREQVHYFNNNGTQIDHDFWYSYDQMNREKWVEAFKASDGTLSATQSQGHFLEYDKNGNRTSDFSFVSGQTTSFDESGNAVTGPSQGFVTRHYSYDAMNRLTVTTQDSMVLDDRVYDAASRAVRTGPDAGQGQAVIDALNGSAQIELEGYDANGRLVQQNVSDTNGAAKYNASFVYDNMGNETSHTLNVFGQTSYTNFYTTTYQKFDGAYKVSTMSATSTVLEPGSTTQTYDVDGNLVSVTDATKAENNRTFVNDVAGKILQKSQNGVVTHFLIANGEVMGSSGDSTVQDNFSQSYDAIGQLNIPGKVPGSYTVMAGDTLQGIAQNEWGDSSLWYLIADANGLSGNADLKVGQRLVIPARVNGANNNYQVFRPYDSSRVVGDTTPNLNAPPAQGGGSSDGCGGFGFIIVLIVTIIVAIYAPYLLGVVETLGEVTLAGAVVGAVAGNLAGQLVGNVIGIQHGFDWKSLAVAVITAGVTEGLTEAGALPPVSSTEPADVALRAAVNTAVNQGARVIVGLQSNFDWKAVAGSAVGSYIGATIGNAVNESLTDAFTNTETDTISGTDLAITNVAKGFAQGFTTSVVTAAVSGGKIDLARMATDAFGNTLASSLGGWLVNGTPQDTTLDQLEQQNEQPQPQGLAPYVSSTVQSLPMFLYGTAPRYAQFFESFAEGVAGAALSNLNRAPTPAPTAADQEDADLGQAMRNAQVQTYAQNADQEDADAGQVWQSQTPAADQPTPDEEPAGPQSVRAGDYGGSLERIARNQLGPDATQADINNYVGQLFEINGITNARTIQPDQEIQLPDAGTPAATSGLGLYGRDIAIGEQIKAIAAARAAEAAAQQAAAQQAAQQQAAAEATPIPEDNQPLTEMPSTPTANPATTTPETASPATETQSQSMWSRFTSAASNAASSAYGTLSDMSSSAGNRLLTAISDTYGSDAADAVAATANVVTGAAKDIGEVGLAGGLRLGADLVGAGASVSKWVGYDVDAKAQAIQGDMQQLSDTLLQAPAETSLKVTAAQYVGAAVGGTEELGNMAVGLTKLAVAVGSVGLTLAEDQAYRALGGDAGFGGSFSTLANAHAQVEQVEQNIVSAAENFVSNPVDSTVAAINAGKTIGGNIVNATVNAATNFYQNTVTAATSNDPYQVFNASAEATGTAVEVVTTVVPLVGELSALSKAERVAEVVNAATRVSEVAEAANTVARVGEAAEVATTAARTGEVVEAATTAARAGEVAETATAAARAGDVAQVARGAEVAEGVGAAANDARAAATVATDVAESGASRIASATRTIAEDVAAEARTGEVVSDALINTTTRASTRDGVNFFKTSGLRSEMSSSAIGRTVLDAADSGKINLVFSEFGPPRAGLMGRSIGSQATVFVKETQNGMTWANLGVKASGYEFTSMVGIHEGLHALGVAGSQRAEALVRLAEFEHLGVPIDRTVMRTVLTEMKGNYNQFPWRSGGSTPNFPGLKF
jgi:YD repeat-containing protein